ncbi:MAG: hypothetical protein SOY67_06025 [Collinsella sp.]|nr:hypothetical protein [Collinsella sp.]
MNHIILSHDTALAVSRSPYANAMRGKRVCCPVQAEVPSPERAHLIATRLGVPEPLHVLVGDVRARRPHRSVVCHAHAGPSAFCELGPGVLVSAPELLLAQLPSHRDVPGALMLGMELMGDYALSPDRNRSVRDRPALMVPAHLQSLANAARPDALDGDPRRMSRSKLARVSRLLIPGARSPKEAEIALLLSLPRRLGGRGIQGIILNHRVDLSREARAVAGRKYLVCDIFIAGAGLELGYDSDSHHLTRRSHESDARRENALRMMGVGYMGMTSGQLHQWSAFDALADRLAAEAGMRLRPLKHASRARQYELWERLLFGRRLRGDLGDS